MDGFHLAEDQLRARGLQGLKGAPETFDRSGFVAMLHQLRSASDVVLAPVFDRTIGDPVAAAIAVPPQIRLVIIEGNYLLLWPEVRPLLDDIWYLDLAPEVRVSRLVARHVEFGKAPDEALAFVRASDEANAARIALDRASADLILDAD
jgi:pantothenate kinase